MSEKLSLWDVQQDPDGDIRRQSARSEIMNYTGCDGKTYTKFDPNLWVALLTRRSKSAWVTAQVWGGDMDRENLLSHYKKMDDVAVLAVERAGVLVAASQFVRHVTQVPGPPADNRKWPPPPPCPPRIYGEYEAINGGVANRLQGTVDRLLEEIDAIARDCTHSDDADATCRNIIDRIHKVKNEL